MFNTLNILYLNPMAKPTEKLKAIYLRKKGASLGQIANSLNVSKSTVSIWVNSVVLTIEQLEKLKKQNIIGAERGRLIGASKQREMRQKRINLGLEKGKSLIKSLTKNEMFIAGIALYWAEGSKKNRSLTLCNSDPKLINFMIEWLKLFFQIPIDQFRCRVGINEIHLHRDSIIKQYWSNITGIPISQFNKTSFKKVRTKKIYENFNDHFGTLDVKIAKPGQLYYDLVGLIEALSEGKYTNTKAR